jgi:prepilin-type N-terminal cleavage/methylation domain-containing protein
MARLRPSGRSGEAGFTLIELMVVVLIIAILIAIAIPTFLGARSRQRRRGRHRPLLRRGHDLRRPGFDHGHRDELVGRTSGGHRGPPLVGGSQLETPDRPRGPRPAGCRRR